MDRDDKDPLNTRRIVLVARDRPMDERVIAGRSDLTIRSGSRQTYERLRERLPAPERARRLVSPARRAQQTAARLVPELPFDVEERLGPRGMGAWEGRTWDDVRREDPRRCETFWSEFGTARAPGGESIGELRNRVTELLTSLTSESDHADTILVTHPNVIRLAVCVVLDLPASSAMTLAVDALGVTRLTHSLLGWRLESHNVTP